MGLGLDWFLFVYWFSVCIAVLRLVFISAVKGGCLGFDWGMWCFPEFCCFDGRFDCYGVYCRLCLSVDLLSWMVLRGGLLGISYFGCGLLLIIRFLFADVAWG